MLKKISTTKAVFFDRDGVINVDKGYIYKIEDFEFQNGLFSLLTEIKKMGYLLIIITNQSGIGRGYYTHEDFKILMDYVQDECLRNNAPKFDAIYYCPHIDSDDCECRKPKAGMILDAKYDLNINLSKSYLIGDKERDIESGINAKIKTTIMFNKTNIKTKANHTVVSLKSIESIIKG